MTINTVLVIVLVSIFYVVFPTIFLLLCHNKNARKIVVSVFAVLFFAILVVGTTAKVSISKEVTTIEYVPTGKWFDKVFSFKFWVVDIQDVLINLAMLFPIGLLVVMLFQNKSFLKIVLIAFLVGAVVGILIEFVQFAFPIQRSPQLSDILLNGTSVLIGAIYYFFVSKLSRRTEKKRI